MNTLDERLQSIRPRLQKLASLDPDCVLGGSEAHEYQLALPLSEASVLEFEKKHEVSLPLDYRRFLLEVGSHGAGPYYGLNPLGDLQHLDKSNRVTDFWKKPFPLRDWFDLTTNPDSMSDAERFSDNWVGGTMCLSHQGCGMYDLLVLTGEESGYVWTDDRSNELGIYPVAPNREQMGESQEDATLFTIAEDERLSFLDWYEWWLDWSFEEAKNLD
ncbi:SMI1/KNR4 family protein [bacterium]|nr:MAG: SMI1/KNR4 family protein [bacterium]